MPILSEVPLLIVTGTVGVGKSAVLDEMHALLRAAHSPHACLDLDALRLSWPERGNFNQAAVVENLRSFWSNSRAAGATRLALAGVLEHSDDLVTYQTAIPGARVTVCLLTTTEPTRLARLRAREVGSGLDWHLHRSIELQTIPDRATLHHFTVTNEHRPLREVALDVLVRAGWLSRH